MVSGGETCRAGVGSFDAMRCDAMRCVFGRVAAPIVERDARRHRNRARGRFARANTAEPSCKLLLRRRATRAAPAQRTRLGDVQRSRDGARNGEGDDVAMANVPSRRSCSAAPARGWREGERGIRSRKKQEPQGKARMGVPYLRLDSRRLVYF
ncbi:unnamed protein product [Burkholderia pseudomallei]|nr:unnamed protein product [Burkholderia pseudomallei]